MPQFMDFHEDLKLPQEAIDDIAAGARAGATDKFGVRRSSSTTTRTARCTASWTHPMRRRCGITTLLSASTAERFTR
jgi:hypothetical protein